MADRAVPDKEMMFPIGKTAPPSPTTNIPLAIIKFLCDPISSPASIMTFRPFEAMTPYSNIDIPPKTQDGIVSMKALTIGNSETTMAIQAAPKVT